MASLFHWLEDKRIHYLILAGWGLLLLRRVIPEAHVDFDDAWMALRYAQHLLDGHGYRWNIGGEPSFGSTSVAFTFWLAGMKFLLGWLLSDVQILAYSSLGFLFLGSLLLMEVSYRLVGEKLGVTRSTVYAFLAICLSGHYWTYHGTTGMDTTMAVFANGLFLWSLICLGEKGYSRPWRWVAFIGAAYFSYLVRMDHGIFIILTPPLLLMLVYRWPWPRVLGLMVLLSIPFWVDLGVKWSYFGDPLPLPYYVKQFGFYEGYIGYQYWNIFTAMKYYGLLVLPFTIIMVWFWHGDQSIYIGVSIGIPLFITFLFLGYSVQIMGAKMRYYVPFVPHLTIVAALIIRTGAESNSPFAKIGKGIVVTSFIAFLTGVMPSLELIREAQLLERSVLNMPEGKEMVFSLFDDSLYDTADKLAHEINKMPTNVTLAAGEHRASAS